MWHLVYKFCKPRQLKMYLNVAVFIMVRLRFDGITVFSVNES